MTVHEIVGNLWDFHDQGHWIAITTNVSVRRDGRAVMGRGVAREAARRYPELQAFLGKVILRSGGRVWPLVRWRIFTYPVKWRWHERADLNLIELSACELVSKVNGMQRQKLGGLGVDPDEKVYLVRPGCGNGGLTWAVVKPVIAPILDDRFVVVDWFYGIRLGAVGGTFMSRYEVKHSDKGLAFGRDHACGEFLMIWRRPTNPAERQKQDAMGPDPDEVLVDKDTLFDRDFDRPAMLRLIAKHGFTLDELQAAEEAVTRFPDLTAELVRINAEGLHG
jgi:hypothetical protein